MINPCGWHNIWSEGYIVSGNSSGAHFWGSAKGASFKDACDQLAATNKDFAEYYNPIKLTFWGCRLYDKEKDARKSFG